MTESYNMSSAYEAEMVVKLPKRATPLLENGDHLTRDEFERRYDAMPPGIKAELIEGVVYMASPVSAGYHGKPSFRMITWLGIYQADTAGTEGAENSTVRLEGDNEMQPDAFLYIDPDKGGQAELDEGGYVVFGPELITEISASSASIDLNIKVPVYRNNKVREYIVWRVYDEAIDWFALRNNRYKPLASGKDGILRSDVFPGLWLDPAAMIRGNMKRVISVLQEGLATKEHAAFVAKLNG
jgi:hypothetical protein